jgi:hypothetical protein
MDNVPPNPNRYEPIQGYLNSASATPEEFLGTSLVYALETILMLHNGGEYARAQTDAMSAVRALRSQNDVQAKLQLPVFSFFRIIDKQVFFLQANSQYPIFTKASLGYF